jgi:hypothetical protein
MRSHEANLANCFDVRNRAIVAERFFSVQRQLSPVISSKPDGLKSTLDRRPPG